MNVLLSIPFVGYLILGLLIYCCVRWKSDKYWRVALAVWVVVLVAYVASNPVAMPTRMEQSTPPPSFEPSSSEVRDMTRKPALTDQERERRLDEKLNAVQEADENRTGG